MTRDDLDRLLSDEEHLLPSSGFAASVMEQIQRDADTPPALPFPWMRALPLLAALAVAMAVALGTGIGAVNDPQTGTLLADRLATVQAIVSRPEIAWTAFAAAITILSAMWPLRLMRHRV